MTKKREILSILVFTACMHVWALEWRLGIDQSTQPFSVGFWPINQTSLFVSQLGFRDAVTVRFGGGPSFSDEYYVLLPERETSFFWYTGVELVRTEGVDSTGAYTSMELDQVLFGDRYHIKRWLSLSLGNESRLLTGVTVDPLFLHRPALRLRGEAADDPFWSVFQAHAGVSGALELGHAASAGFWVFPVAEVNLDLKVPVIGEYLYLSLSGSGTATFPSLTPGVAPAEGAYSGYTAPLRFGGTAEMRSRFLKIEPIAKVAVELVVFGSATGTAAALDLSGLSGQIFTVGAFLEGALEIPYLLAVRLQVGATYDLETRGFGFLFAVR
jgi:hypothetical protein